MLRKKARRKGFRGCIQAILDDGPLEMIWRSSSRLSRTHRKERSPDRRREAAQAHPPSSSPNNLGSKHDSRIKNRNSIFVVNRDDSKIGCNGKFINGLKPGAGGVQSTAFVQLGPGSSPHYTRYGNQMFWTLFLLIAGYKELVLLTIEINIHGRTRLQIPSPSSCLEASCAWMTCVSKGQLRSPETVKMHRGLAQRWT